MTGRDAFLARIAIASIIFLNFCGPAATAAVTVEIKEVSPANPNPTLPDKPSRGSLRADLKDDGTNKEIKPDGNTMFVWSVETVSVDGTVEPALRSGVSIADGDKQTMRYEARWGAKGTYVVIFKVVVTDPDWTPNSATDMSDDITIKVADCTTATSNADVQDQVLTIDASERRQTQKSVANVNSKLTVCTDTGAITLEVAVSGLCLDQRRSDQFSASPSLAGFGAGTPIMDGGTIVGFKFSKQVATLDTTNGNRGSHLMTYSAYEEGIPDSETVVAGVVGVFTEFGRHVCIRWKVAATGEVLLFEAKQGPPIGPETPNPRQLCVNPE